MLCLLSKTLQVAAMDEQAATELCGAEPAIEQHPAQGPVANGEQLSSGANIVEELFLGFHLSFHLSTACLEYALTWLGIKVN